MTRQRLPGRRSGWTQKVRIDGQTFYCTFGEYDNGCLGEIFIEAHKEGSFTRGILSALGRIVSISLQNGVSAAEISSSLRHLNYPPKGEVIGSPSVIKCSSITDWVAQEIEREYVDKQSMCLAVGTSPSLPGDVPEKPVPKPDSKKHSGW